MSNYVGVAGAQVAGVSVHVRDNLFEPTEGLCVLQPQFVVGAMITPIRSFQGRFVRHPCDRFTNIGTLTFRPANTPWYIRTEGGSFRTVVCEYSEEKFQAVTGRSNEWSDRELRACYDIRSARILQMLQRLSEEAFAPGFASDILTEALGVAVLVDLSRYFDSISQTTKCENTGLENWQLRRIIEFINELSGRQPTLLDLAELCGIGKRTFMRRFKKSTGLTVSDYVQQQQLIKAEHYLQETDLPIKEISYRVGFASPSNFTLAFRRAVGQTPGQFRRHIK